MLSLDVEDGVDSDTEDGELEDIDELDCDDEDELSSIPSLSSTAPLFNTEKNSPLKLREYTRELSDLYGNPILRRPVKQVVFLGTE